MANLIYRNCCECGSEIQILCNDPKIFCNLSCSSKNSGRILAERAIQKYSNSPKFCTQCNCTLPYSKKSNKFCSHSCSAIHSNKKRKARSQASRNKISTALKGKIKMCPVSWCKVCKTQIRKRNIKTCSVECKNKLHSNHMKNYITTHPMHKFNRSPLKRSWMETSFEEWLISHGMKHSLHGYLYEIRFRNKLTKKNWRADYVFPKKRLIIELDGTHHNERKELDIIRDEYLKSRGWNVLRVTHAEYKKKIKEQMIYDLLFKS